MKKIVSLSLLLLFACYITAQIGTSSGSLSYARDAKSSATSANYHMPNAETIIVEDFMNYHLHRIEIPQEEDVAVSIDYDNALLSSDDSFILQVGIATQPTSKRSAKLNRANVSLVIDVSGSMSGQKIVSAREAARRFVESMNDGDYISIILFNEKAWVLQPAVCLTENRKRMYEKIRDIEAENYTNINDGMLLGYKEVSKNHSIEVNSRVILLTDGQTNRGETNPEKIACNSMNFNNKGIDISTIGVGQSLDFGLLRLLADKGRGSNYFIGEDEEDMYKVFDEEIESLLYGIGKNPDLTINLPQGWKIETCYGYKPIYGKQNSLKINLPNLGASSTRIVLLKVRQEEGCDGNISATLNYSNNGKPLSVSKKKGYNKETASTNAEIEKNYTIASMAQSLRDAAILNNKGDYAEARSVLKNAVSEVAYCAEDTDIKRVYDIVKLYIPEEKKTDRPRKAGYRY